MKKTLLCLLSLVCTMLYAQESYSGYTLANEGAWCWFADPRATHYENDAKTINMSYVGYIDVHGNIKATQYNWLTGEKSDVLVRSYFQPDDHNNPTFLVLPDERVLIIYSRHTDEAAFYYRVSLKPGDITQLGEEKRLSTEGKGNTTYPSPFILSDDPTHWYLCWRGINWHPTMARLTMPDENGDCHFEWGPYQMVQSTGARPYAKYYSNGKDKLYVTYTTGHPDNEQPNWVYFNVININGGGEPTLEDIKGTRLSTIKNGAFNVSKTDSYKTSYPYTVVDNGNGNLRDWVWQIALDSDQQPCIAMVRINGGKTQHEYYYAKWTGSAWRLTDLADGGGQFHQSPGVEMCYSGGLILDQQNPKDIYLSIPTAGQYGNVFEIWKYTLDNTGKIQSKEQITRNSRDNNVRPYVLPGSAGTPLRLTWMKGYYQYWIVCKNFPNGYPTSIQCDYNWQAPASTTPGWSISTTLTMDAAKYYGTLATWKGIEYALDNNTHRPYITINGVRYDSQNQLYTSDAWKTCPATTDGKSYFSILQSWNLSLTYNSDKKQLTVYRNGIIDQVIDVEINDFPEEATNGCMSQTEINDGMEQSALEALAIPTTVSTDIVLPSSIGGIAITWKSSNNTIISDGGLFKSPKEITEVTLTATTLNASREFKISAMPRNIEQNIRAFFTFDKEEEGITLVGKAKLNKGVLDLTSNTASDFNGNGYAVIDAGLLKGLRSYTVLLTVKANSLSSQPRLYDFGANSGNSVFLRANAMSAGIKYAGGTTTMVNATTTLQTGKEYNLAVTFDATTQTTSIYVDGQLDVSGKANINEPNMIYELIGDGRNYVGRTQWWDDGGQRANNVDFVGTYDNLYIYDIALTRKEICQMQNLIYEVGEYKENFENGDFESTYSVYNNPQSDRAIYQPKGWSVDYSVRDVNDLTSLKSGDLYYSNFFSSKPKPTNAGSKTLWIRQRWGASVLDYYQNVLFPEGDYILTADVFSSNTTSSNKATIYAGEESTTPTSANAWQNLSIEFSSDGIEPTKIGLQANHTADEFIVGFDNFVITKKVPVGIHEISEKQLQDNSYYDLSGRRVSPTYEGIVINKGKKLILK